MDIIDLLGIDSITFYVDEWEKISTIQNCQEYTANYIDTLLDNPIYFWIGIVPYRGLTEENNLQTLCWKCNRNNSDKIFF